MSFLKKLFGGGSGGGEAAPATPAEVYKDFAITPDPMKDGQQWRLAGYISKTVDGEEKRHHLIRADLFAGQDVAATATIAKARQVIDEQGDGLFR
ncbi:MAG: HlyU family transcriptional regulator [Pseudomonadota bacterium]